MKRVILAAAVAVLSFSGYALTSASYVQDGLIAQWDGIDNVLAGGVRQHDENATVWSDLTGNGFDFAVGDYFGTQLQGWTANSLKAKSCYNVPCAKSCKDYVTIEICAKHNKQYQCLFNSGDGLKKFVAVMNTSVQFYNAVKLNYAIGDNDFFQAAAVHSPTVSAPVVYTNGVAAKQTASDSWGGNVSSTCLGRGANSYQFTGEYYAIRLYDRALTPEEIAKNAQIDAVRFLGASCTDKLEIVGDPVPYGTVTPAYGKLSDVEIGSNMTMTASASVEIDDGALIADCLGYEVRADDVVVDSGTFEIGGETRSVEYVHPDNQAGVTFAWKWVTRVPFGIGKTLTLVSSEIGSSVVSADVKSFGLLADSATLTFRYGTTSAVSDGMLTVEDVAAVGPCAVRIPHLLSGQTYYVQATLANDEGESVTSDVFELVQPAFMEPGVYTSSAYAQQDHLVAFWDGLENIGVGRSDRSATTWADISGNGFDWTLSGDTSRYGWTERGLRLKGVGLVGSLATKAAADFENKITTIEFIYANREKKDGIIFGPGFGTSTYLYTDGRGRVGFYGTSYTDNAGTTAVLGETNCYSVVYTRTGARPTGVKKFWVNGIETAAETMADYWGVSTPGLGDKANKERPANGELLAIRIYDIELTDAEREQNRNIDDLRYFQGVNGALPLEFVNGALVLTVEASDAERTVTFYWGETYGGTNEWASTSGTVTVPAGATTVSYAKPNGWGSSVWFARAKLGEGASAHWSKTAEARPSAALGMGAKLALASSVFGSSEIAAQVTGIGPGAASATLAFAYGSTPDLADGTVQLTVTDAGEWRGTLPRLRSGQTYYVQATLSNDVAEVVMSEVLEFVQPEVVEPGVFTSDSYVKKGLVAQWDGIDNAGRGAHNPTATSWADLSGNNHTLGNFVSGVTWTDNAYATPTTAYSTSATITGTEVGVYDFQSYEIVFAADQEVPNSGAQIFATGAFKGLVLIKNASKRGFQVMADGRFFLCDYDTTGQLQQLYADFADDGTPDTAFYGGAALDTTTYSEGWGSGGFRFGYSGTSYPFYGRICSIRLYGRKLTAAEREQNRLADAMRYNRGLDGGLPIELKDGQFTVTVPASDEARKATFCWGETYGGVGDWASTTEVTIPAGATTVSCAQPALWGSSVWFARAKVGEGDEAAWTKTLIASAANTPAVSLDSLDGLGGDTMIVKGTVDALGGESCTLTVLTGTREDAITQDWDDLEGLTVTETGDFEFELFESSTASPRYLSPGGTYYVKIIATAPNGRTAWSSVKSVKMAGAAAFKTVSAPTYDKRTMTVTASMADVGMGGKTMVELWVGEAGGTLQRVAGPLEVAAVNQNFQLSYMLPKYETDYTWELRASNASAGASVNPMTPTATATASAPDSTTYTWMGAGADNSWTNSANWSDDKSGDCLGYPQTKNSTAKFTMSADVEIDLPRSGTTINSGTLNLGAKNIDVRFHSADTNGFGLVLNGLTMPGQGSRWTIDHAVVYRDGGYTMSQDSTIVVTNGADLYLGNVYFQNLNSRLEIKDESKMSVNDFYGGKDGSVVIGDSTFEVRAWTYAGNYDGSLTVRFEGTHPRWSHLNVNSPFKSTAANRPVTLDFLIPEGGYEFVPLHGVLGKAMSNAFGGNANETTYPITVNVLDESPAAFVRGEATYDLISWSKGINTAKVVTNNVPHEVPGSEFVWSDETTSPTGLAVKIVGYVASNFILVKSNDEEFNPEGFNADSGYGKHSLVDGAQVTLSAPTSYFNLADDERVYIVGWELWSKLDDDSDEMTLVRSSADPGDGEDIYTCCYTHTGYSELIWVWRHQKRVKVTVVGGEHGSVSSEEQWIDAGATSSVKATPEEGYAVAWTAGIANERMFENPLVFDETAEPYDLTATFFQPSANEGEKAGLFADYGHSQSIDFTGYAGETELKDFPALIRLREGTGGFSYAECAADGRDVRFCGADGQELVSEVANWNSNGTSEFWVKVPSLTKSTRIYLVWGNANAPARTPGTYAFNEGYRGVWTMEPAKNVLLDRSTYGQHAACFEEEVTSVTGGVVGGARRFSGTDKCYAYLGVGSAAFMEPKEFTAECWFKVTEYPADWTYFLASGTRDWNNTSQACTFGIDSEGRIFGSNCGAYATRNRRHPLSQEVASKGEWHHAAYTQAANGEEFLYLDGVMVGCYTNVMANFGWGEAFYTGKSRQGNPTLGGWWPYAGRDNYRYFAGEMDEARLSGEVRSADWVRATYQTVAESETFAVFGRPVYKLTVDGVAQPVAPTIVAATPAVVEANGVKTTYLGYEIVADGTRVASDEGLSVSRAWPKDAHAVAVRWLRKVEYKVNDDYVEPGSLVRVTAPDAPAGQAFHSWGGDCPTLEVFTASFDLPADRPRTLTPNYAPLTEVTTNGCANADEAGMAFKAAIDAAVAAGTPQVVLVGDGVYAISNVNAMTISSPVVVRSKNGFEKTALLQLKNPAANNPAWTMFTVSHPGALLEGLDFQSYGGYGGAYQSIASVTEGHFSRCRFVMQAGRGYGAINGPRFVAQSGGWCRNCVFTAFDDITRSYDSGAAGVFDHMIMDSCVITNLRTSSAYNYVISPIRTGVNAVIRNTLVAKNFSQTDHNGGAASIDGYSAKGIAFENCTIADNKNAASSASAAMGGGIYTDYPLLVVNTILSGNKANSVALGDDFYGPVGAVCSMSKDFSGGEFGSMTALPAYQTDEEGVPDTVFYRARGVSPSRDAGYPTAWSRTPGAWDLLGTNRVAEAEVDIGACEYAPTEGEDFDVNVRIEGDFTQRDRAEATFIAAVSGAKGEVTYDWDFGDGGTSSEANPVYTYTKPGWYTVKLTITDEKGQTKTFRTTDPVKVRTSVCYINANGSGTPPYATRETGANSERNFADAMSDKPSTIVICSNTTATTVYGESISVNYPVTVIGEDRETSMINEKGTITGPGIVFSTLTYKGGNGHHTGFTVSHATLTNVVVRNATIVYSGNGYNLALGEGARLVDSLIVGANLNHGQGNVGGAALRIVGKGVVVDRCVVTNNFSTSGAKTYAAGIRVAGAYDPMPVVRNSFIGYNRCFDKATMTNAVGGAGIYAEGPVRVENCTIVSNQTCGAGAAVYVKAGTAEIVNTVIACNAGGLTNAAEICSNEVFVAEGASVMWQKCRVPAEAGIDDAGVTTGDPKFNFNARKSRPFWSLRGGSPCKDAGVRLDWMPGATDLIGNPRAYGIPDMGCYESQVGGTAIIVR